MRFWVNRPKRHLETETLDLPRATEFLPYFDIITVGPQQLLMALIGVPDLSGLLRSIKFCKLKKSIFFVFLRKKNSRFFCFDALWRRRFWSKWDMVWVLACARYVHQTHKPGPLNPFSSSQPSRQNLTKGSKMTIFYPFLNF